MCTGPTDLEFVFSLFQMFCTYARMPRNTTWLYTAQSLSPATGSSTADGAKCHLLLTYMTPVCISLCAVLYVLGIEVLKLTVCTSHLFPSETFLFVLKFSCVFSQPPLCFNISDNVVAEVPNVALSSCHVELMSQPCRNNVCAQGTVTVTAVTDFTKDGNRVSLLSAQPAQGSPRLWRGYNPTALKVSQTTQSTLARIRKCNISRLSAFVFDGEC